jgi:hypothetical protein
MKKIILVALLLSLLSCKPAIPPRETPFVQDTELCEAAEVRLLKLKCEEGQPTKKGTRFKDVCEDVQKNGGVFLNPRCLSNITDCNQIDICTGSN